MAVSCSAPTTWKCSWAIIFIFDQQIVIMEKRLLFFLLSMSTMMTVAGQRTQSLFDTSWKFHKGDVANGENRNFEDNNWRNVELPHDWSIEDLPGQSDSVIGPFSTKSVGTTATGYTIGGTAWYRKHFKLNVSPRKKALIYFDGIYV